MLFCKQATISSLVPTWFTFPFKIVSTNLLIGHCRPPDTCIITIRPQINSVTAPCYYSIYIIIKKPKKFTFYSTFSSNHLNTNSFGIISP
jgi:hypothetical protein